MTDQTKSVVRGTVIYDEDLGGSAHIIILPDETIPDGSPVTILRHGPNGEVGGLEPWMGRGSLTQEEHDRLMAEYHESKEGPARWDDWLPWRRQQAIASILQPEGEK